MPSALEHDNNARTRVVIGMMLIVSENAGGLKRSMQHWLRVYLPEFESPTFFVVVDSDAERSRPSPTASSRTDPLLRQVLPQEPIGVFVRAALPGALRIAEVDFHIGSHCKLLVLGHLQPAIPGQRPTQRRWELSHVLAQSGHHARVQSKERAARRRLCRSGAL